MEKKIKVLLVEDDEDQINWARQQIGELCNLIIVKTAIDALWEFRYQRCQKNNISLVISDLIIPGFDENEEKELMFDDGMEAFERKFLREEFLAEPDAKNGWKIFSEALNLCFHDYYQGIALVSNFEHHIEERGLWSFKEIYEGLNALRIVSASFKYDDASFIKKKPGGLEKVVIVADSLGISWWPYFLKNGRVYTNGDLQKDNINPYKFCLGGAKMLKPYRKVFEYLTK